MRILLLRPATHLHLNIYETASRNPFRSRAFGVVAFGVWLLRVKAYQGEFNLGARSASRFKPMFRPAFRDVPNEEDREYLIAGSLQ
jgi:hypothetical protein